MIETRQLKNVVIFIQIILKSCLESGKFPSELKKENVIPSDKKDDRKISEN